MDTYHKWYEVNCSIPEIELVESARPSFLYKYVTLSTFFSMMQNGTFRLHSIVSQSDSTESLYLGDLVCGEYENEMKRFAGILEEKNILIGSFTDSFTDSLDDQYMWDRYADNGKGVLLEFRINGDQNCSSIMYVDRKNSPLLRYREKVETLKTEGIRIHYSIIDQYRRFVKDNQYSDEKEWRLVHEFIGNLDRALYGDKIVWYHDFSFDGHVIPDLGLQLNSVVVGPNQPKGTNNFPQIAEMVYNCLGDQVTINKSRIKSWTKE